MSYTFPHKPFLVQANTKKFREILFFLQSVPRSAHWVGLGALLLWVVKALCFDHRFAPGWEISLDEVLNGMLSAVVAGYVFYLLFAQWPDYQSRRRLDPFIFKTVSYIVGDCMAVLHEMSRVTGRDIRFHRASRFDVEDAMKSVQAVSRPNMIFMNGQYATWYQYFYDRQLRTLNFIEQLIEQNRFLDSEIISMITEIRGSSYMFITKLCVQMPPTANTDLSHLSSVFGEYFLLCRNVAEWYRHHAPREFAGALKDS